MIRLALVAHLSEISGAGTALLEKALGLDGSRFRPLLVLPGHGPLKQKALDAGVEVFVVPNVEASLGAASTVAKLAMVGKRMGYVARLAEFFRRQKVDVVLVNSTASIFAGMAARLAGRPVVWQVHEVIENPSRGTRVKLAAIERMSRALLYDAVAGQKSFCAPRVARKLVVRNFIDYSRYAQASFTPETERSLGVQPGQLLVTMNGAFRRKAPDIFLEAAAQVVRQMPQLPLRFAVLGAPPEHENAFFEGLKQGIGRMGLEGRVCFAGLRRDIPQVLKRTSVFVSPSRNEAMPIIVTEAMAAGTPVVATDIGDCRLFLEEGALGEVVPPEDPQKLAEAICHVLGDPQAALARAQLAQRRIASLYEAKSFWAPLEQLLYEVCPR